MLTRAETEKQLAEERLLLKWTRAKDARASIKARISELEISIALQERAAASRIARLEAAARKMREHGWHSERCNSRSLDRDTCECGYDDLRAALESEPA